MRQHVADGHDVLVIASTEMLDLRGNLYYVEPTQYSGTDGAPVIRLPYRKFLPHLLMRKLRTYAGLESEIQTFRPDVILFHGACAWDLSVVADYVRSNDGVVLYVDSHEDRYNSATNFLSKYVLHRGLYRQILSYSRSSIEKILCYSVESMEFVRETYGLTSREIEFFPLGGDVYDDVEYGLRRSAARVGLGLGDHTILFTQTGKMGGAKKLLESLKAFSSLSGNRDTVFLVAGQVLDDIRTEVQAHAAQDPRIRVLGWQNSEELADLLCATDVYVQPGTQSATLQNAICARCAVIVDEVPSHIPFVDANGWRVSSEKDLRAAMSAAVDGSVDLVAMARRSMDIASEILDYKLMARRIAPFEKAV